MLSLPYDRRIPNVTSILHQNWSYLIKVNPDLKKNVLPKPPMVNYTRAKKFRDVSVRAGLPGQSKTNNLKRRVAFKRCNLTRCKTCPFTKNTTSHKYKFTNKKLIHSKKNIAALHQTQFIQSIVPNTLGPSKRSLKGTPTPSNQLEIQHRMVKSLQSAQGLEI